MKYFQVFILLLSLNAASLQLRAQEQPNIILIMADDLGREALSTYGNEENVTPHLDRLAASGMLFENCHATPLCTPSRVQLMTGKYNFRNYVGFGILDPKEVTFAHLLKKAGYQTCIAGKWQLYGNQKQRKLAGGRKGSLPVEAGFDHYRLWQVKERGSRYAAPTLDSKETGVETFPGEYAPDLFVDYIGDFMENRDKERPFFVYYPMCLVHDPFEPTPFSTGFKEYRPQNKVNDPMYFGDMVEYMDHLLGRIVGKVKEMGIEENTLIIFIGDNGTDRDVVSRANGVSLRGNKGYTNDLGTHVPMIVSWPGHIEPGSVNDNLIDFTDFLPTLLDASGSSATTVDVQFDGISFYPQLTGNISNRPRREWIFCHYDPNWGQFPKRRFVFNKEWKLYDNGEIYHLASDSDETQPVAKKALDPAARKTIDEFETVLSEMR